MLKWYSRFLMCQNGIFYERADENALKDTLGGNSPKHQNMQYLTHAIDSKLLYINDMLEKS